MTAAVIEVSEEAIRVGGNIRPLRFTDQMVDGFIFRDGEVAAEGHWASRDWTNVQRASYDARLAAHRQLLYWRALRPLAKRLAEWSLWVDPWAYDDESDWREPTPGIRGWIARRTSLPRLARSLLRATSKPPHCQVTIANIAVF